MRDPISRSEWRREQIRFWFWDFIAAMFVVVIVAIPVSLGFFAGRATASPLSVRAHQSSLYGGTRAEVRVYATVRASKPTTATILVEALDTSHGDWGAAGGAGIAHVRLHKGRNHIHRTVTVERLEQRYCFWRPEHRLEHPECPFLTVYHRDPYVGVAAVFDRVLVSVLVGQRRLAGVESAVQRNGGAPWLAAPSRPLGTRSQ